MSLAKTLMIQGTASSVGKSILVTGLCRIFAQEGYRVAPFKAQNMSLNAAVTKSGGEIGRAQAVQAEAAGVEPTVEMNPILLKPESDSRSQVIVMGRPLAAMEAREYYEQRTGFLEIVQDALSTLRQQYDLIIVEGAGSPVELNLAHYDLVNMRVAQVAEAPVLLVGNIDQGGIFASLLGTLMLLEPEERARVKGLIVNKFRGDLSLWQAGERLLAARSGLPVVGTVPFLEELRISEEDSVALEDGGALLVQSQAPAPLEVVILRLPYLSNYDEFDALAAEPLVRVHMIARQEEFPEHCDLIILPGSKNTFADLSWLWRQGFGQRIRRLAKQGCAIMGVCGGYQMLGERLRDPSGVETEAGTVAAGLGLLPVETVLHPAQEKVTLQCQVQIRPKARRGLFAQLQEHTLQAYQIHVGQTSGRETDEALKNEVFCVDMTETDGWLSTDGWCAGCYLHGLFENDHFRHTVIEALAQRQFPHRLYLEQTRFSRQREYDRLADVLRQYLDLEYVKGLVGD